MTNKTIEYYMKLPYRVILHPSPEGGYAVSIPDLPGCISQGETAEEAMANIGDAKKCWLESALEDNIEIPEPTAMFSADYSGKFSVRVPKSLHKALVEKAKTENVSLNQLVIYHLSKSIGHRGI